MNCFKVFGLTGTQEYAQKIVDYLDAPLSKHIEKYFEDKECYLRSDENVRACDVYIISSLYADEEQTTAEKLVKLFLFVGSLKDASARRITVVAPYLAYSRQDRKTESRAPITTKYVANLLKSSGVDRFLTMDVHNLSAFQNAFNIPADNLEAKNLICDYLCGVDRNGKVLSDKIKNPLKDHPKDIVVLSPDSGGMNRASRFRDGLAKRLKLVNEIDVVYLDKRRNGSSVEASKIVGDVKNKKVIILDDLIASGKTIKLSHEVIEREGGETWAVCATHGLFVGDAAENLKDIKQLIITDTIPPFRIDNDWAANNLHIIPTAKLFAQAIKRTHEEGGSISELLS